MFAWNFNIACDVDGTVNTVGVDETIACETCGNDVTSVGKTVRDTLAAAYGDGWTRAVNGVATVAKRTWCTYVTRAGQSYPDMVWHECETLVINWTVGRDVHGYEDTVGVANYRVLTESWAECDGLNDGPYSGQACIAVDLDSAAPNDLVDVLDALESYPVLDDQVHSEVEQEMIVEHWESYGRDDMLSAVADALNVDGRDCLTDYARETIENLVFCGYLGDNYPTVVDVSAVDFNTADIIAWVSEYVTTTVGVDDTVKVRRWSGDTDGLDVDTRFDSWVTPDPV
jgi:hypothetical protein